MKLSGRVLWRYIQSLKLKARQATLLEVLEVLNEN